MSARTYGPEEQAKLKRIVDEGANVLSEVEDPKKVTFSWKPETTNEGAEA